MVVRFRGNRRAFGRPEGRVHVPEGSVAPFRGRPAKLARCRSFPPSPAGSKGANLNRKSACWPSAGSCASRSRTATSRNSGPNAGFRWTTSPWGEGYRSARPNWKNACANGSAPRTTAGAGTKRTSGSKANGATCAGPRISAGRRWTLSAVGQTGRGSRQALLIQSLGPSEPPRRPSRHPPRWARGLPARPRAAENRRGFG
jgi:hypothetical protein